MKNKKREKLKFYILILLVIISIMQVGILWNYQTPGNPTNFLLSWFSRNDTQATSDMSEYFSPYRIIVSQGFDELHFLLMNQDKHYSTLWKDTKYYLANIFRNAKDSIYLEASESWGNIVVKKAIIFEFKAVINQNLLKGFLKESMVQKENFKGIYKIALLPFEDLNNNFTFYIFDGTKVFKSVVPINPNGISKYNYDKMISSISNSNSQESFSVVKEVIPHNDKSLFKINPDIPVIVGSDQYRDMQNIICSSPDIIKNLSTGKNSDLISLANLVLGRDSENYDFGIDALGAIVFKNLTDRYSIYKTGVLEYKYLTDIDNTQKGDISSAFEKSIAFILSKNKLISSLSNPDIYLSDVSETSNYYIFKFDYKFNNMPIFFKNYNDQFKSNNAIIIYANDKKVINCSWILKSFKQDTQLSKYNLSFERMLEDTFATYKNLDYKVFSINDFFPAYVYDVNTANVSLKPVWMINTMNDKSYIVAINEKRGD